VQRVTAAEAAVFVKLQPVGRVLFVLERVVVALLTLVAAQGYFDSHNGSSLFFRDFSRQPPCASRRTFFTTKNSPSADR
jgi:hypothetical protein